MGRILETDEGAKPTNGRGVRVVAMSALGVQGRELRWRREGVQTLNGRRPVHPTAERRPLGVPLPLCWGFPDSERPPLDTHSQVPLSGTSGFFDFAFVLLSVLPLFYSIESKNVKAS